MDELAALAVDRLIEADPKAALAKAEEFLAGGSLPSWQALALMGSARRACGMYSAAGSAFHLALERVHFLSANHARKAHLDLGRRIGRLWLDLGQYDLFLSLSEWRVDEDGTCLLARVELALALYATSGDLKRAKSLLEQVLICGDPYLTRSAWQVSALIAIQTGDSTEAAKCLEALEKLPHEGAARRHLAWLRGIAARERGSFREAEQILASVSNELRLADDWAGAGVALIDAAICAAKSGDWPGVQEFAGEAFRILAGIPSREAKSALLLFVRANAAQRVTVNLLVRLRQKQARFLNRLAA